MAFSQRVIQAYQAGVNERRAAQKQAEEAEDRKLEMERRQIELKALKLQDKLLARKLAVEQAQLMSGQPARRQFAGERGTTQPPESGMMPIPAGFEQVIPHERITIPGIEELGVGDVSVQPPTLEEQLSQQRAAKQQEMFLKQFEPFNLGVDQQRVIPSLTGGPATIFRGQTKAQTPTLQETDIIVDGKGPVRAILVKNDDGSFKYVDPTTKQPINGKIGTYERQREGPVIIGGLPSQAQSRVQALASSFDDNPVIRQYNETALRAANVQKILQGPWTGPGDMAIIFEFMRSLDPTSVVRESEYETAAKTGNLFKGWAARFNGLINPSGGFLSDQVKQDFGRVLQGKIGEASRQVNGIYQDFGRRIDLITGQKGSGTSYLTDYPAVFPMNMAAPTATGTGAARSGGSGNRVVDFNSLPIK